jgi:hypothetical protein
MVVPSAEVTVLIGSTFLAVVLRQTQETEETDRQRGLVRAPDFSQGTAADRRRLDESCSRTAFGPVLCHQGSLPVTKVSEDGLRDWQLPRSLASMVDGILLVELPHPVADRPGGLASDGERHGEPFLPAEGITGFVISVKHFGDDLGVYQVRWTVAGLEKVEPDGQGEVVDSGPSGHESEIQNGGNSRAREQDVVVPKVAVDNLAALLKVLFCGAHSTDVLDDGISIPGQRWLAPAADALCARCGRREGLLGRHMVGVGHSVRGGW